MIKISKVSFLILTKHLGREGEGVFRWKKLASFFQIDLRRKDKCLIVLIWLLMCHVPAWVLDKGPAVKQLKTMYKDPT